MKFHWLTNFTIYHGKLTLMLESSLFIALIFSCQLTHAGITPDFTQPESSQEIKTEPVISEIDTILHKIELQGDKLKSFQAQMTYELTQQITSTKIVRNGELWYQVDENSIQAKIHFDDHLQYDLDDEPDERPKPVKYNEDYTFDGQWLTRRNERTKMIQKWEIAKKDWSRDSFRLGQGPFPLPFAIRKQDVINHFEIQLIPPVAALEKLYPAVKDTDHLQLKPKADSPYAKDYHTLDIWVSKKLSIPTQISYSNKEYEITTVSWNRIELDKPLKPEIFQLKKTGSGWTEETHPLEEDTHK